MAQEPTQQELFQEALAPPPAQVQEPQAQPETPAAPETPQQPPAEPGQGIPSWRLKEEMDARREAENRFRQLEEEVARMRAAQPPEKEKGFFDDPGQATTRLIVQQLQPFVEATQRQMMAMGKMVADQAYGADVVSEAEKAFMEARHNQSLDPVDYERVVQSPNRYAECVNWYRNRSVQQTVGTDPAAWFEKQLEAKMADPKFLAQMLEKARGAQPGTSVQLPPSLSKITAAKGNGSAAEDGSDPSLWQYAMGKGSG